MAIAQETGVRSFISLEELCADCPLRDGGHFDPDFIEIDGQRVDDKGMRTRLRPSSADGYGRDEYIRGTVRSPDLVEGFNNCSQPEVSEEKIMCGALARLNRKAIHG